MSGHPLNLALRFLLELAALLAMGVWGWYKGEGWLRFVLAVGIPILAAVLWAVFRVPGDPGPAPVAVPGWVRLLFEIALFAFSVWALSDAGLIYPAWALGVTAALHYLSSFDRVLWMLKQ